MAQSYEAFVSFDDRSSDGKPSRDGELAADIQQVLSGRGIKVVSSQSFRQTSDQKALDVALGDAAVLVVVATSPTHLDCEWVKYAWNRFIDDGLSGLKPKRRVFPYIDGFRPDELPTPLRQFQTVVHGPDSLGRLFNVAAKAMGYADEGKHLDVARELAEAMSALSEDVWCAGWLDMWEYILWDFALKNPLEEMISRMAIGDNPSVDDINHVMELSMKCQGWIIFDEGFTWIPLDDWHRHLADPEKHSLKGKGIVLDSSRT
jgi:hypothetical protein